MSWWNNYVLLPHNDEVIKPRAHNTFLDGLAELGVEKRLIKNKYILNDLLEKEKVYRENGEGQGDDDSDRSDISNRGNGEESQSESNDGESDNESDQEEISQKESSKPRHHCQSCPQLWWLPVSVPHAFGKITFLFVPFVITTYRLISNK